MKGLAPGLNTIPSTSVLSESEMFITEEDPKVAVSAELFGTVTGDQFCALFQLPLAGEVDHVALPAKAEPLADNSRTVAINGKSCARAQREAHSSTCVAYMGLHGSVDAAELDSAAGRI